MLFSVSTAFPAVSVPPTVVGGAFGLAVRTTPPATAGGTDTVELRELVDMKKDVGRLAFSRRLDG
jgi:hypothetical protein